MSAPRIDTFLRTIESVQTLLGNEVLEIQQRRREDKPFFDRCANEREGAKRRDRYEADTERLSLIRRFIELPRVAVRYGMTADEYRGRFDDQGGCCAICHRELGPDRIPVVDHNHATGQVRGLLCGTCNTALGMFQDSPDVLDAALAYLERNGCYGPNTEDL